MEDRSAMMGWGGQDDHGAGVERRGYPRFEVTIIGACSVAGGIDVPCSMIDLSMSGAALHIQVDASISDAIVVSLPQMGLLRGRVARVFEGGLGIVFDQNRPQRERVAAFLIWLVARRLDPDLEDRSFERIVPLRRIVEISVNGATTTSARIIDVSRSGVALTTTATASPGDTVRVGGTDAVVVRLFAGGLAARFIETLHADLDVTIIL